MLDEALKREGERASGARRSNGTRDGLLELWW